MDAPVTTAAPAQATSTPAPQTPKSAATVTPPNLKAAPPVAAEPKAAPEPKAETKAVDAEEWWEVPTDGKIERLTKAEVLRRASLAGSATKRYEEAAAIRKQNEAIMARISDPEKAIEFITDPKRGLSKEATIKAIEKWYAANVIEPSELSPEQLKQREMEQKIREYEERDAREAEEKAKKETENQDSFMRESIQKQIIKTMEESGLPKTRFFMQRIAHWTNRNLSQGINAPQELIIEQVRKEQRDIINNMVSAADGDMLVNLLGEDTVKKIRRYDLAKIREKRGLGKQPEPEPTPSFKEGETITEAEVRRRLREWK